MATPGVEDGGRVGMFDRFQFDHWISLSNVSGFSREAERSKVSSAADRSWTAGPTLLVYRYAARLTQPDERRAYFTIGKRRDRNERVL